MRDKLKKLRLLALGLGVAAVSWGGAYAYMIVNIKDALSYTEIIENIEESVYDGDTILDVPVLLYRFEDAEPFAPADIWPGIQKRTDGIYALSDIRLRGIDAPEHRVSTSLSEEERNRIKARAAAAEAFLEDLIKRSIVSGMITIRNPAHDLYSGRVLADVIVYHVDYIPGSGAEGGEVNVADALVKAGLAVPYDGGEKTFDWGAETLVFD